MITAAAPPLMIVNAGEHELLSYPIELLRRSFRKTGALLFRGFGADPFLMKRFAERFARRFNCDQSRPAVPGTNGAVQRVTEGMAAVAPHSEQANSPFRPDAILFSCTTPSAREGETLLWDGIEAWRRIAPRTREFLSSRRLRFFQRYAAANWQAFLGGEISTTAVHAALRDLVGVSYHLAPDQSLYLEYVCSPVVSAPYSAELAFANSMILEYRTLQDRRPDDEAAAALRFETGEPVTAELICELMETLEPITQRIQWKAGDLAMIDNRRFMHGRTAFSDADRELYSCMCFLDF